MPEGFVMRFASIIDMWLQWYSASTPAVKSRITIFSSLVLLEFFVSGIFCRDWRGFQHQSIITWVRPRSVNPWIVPSVLFQTALSTVEEAHDG